MAIFNKGPIVDVGEVVKVTTGTEFEIIKAYRCTFDIEWLYTVKNVKTGKITSNVEEFHFLGFN